MKVQGVTLVGTTVRDASIVPGNNQILYLDAGTVASYSGTGTTWYDLSGRNNNTVGYVGSTPIHSVGNGGYFTFNGSNYFQTLGSNYNINYTGKTVFVSGKLSNPFANSSHRCLFGQTGSGNRNFNTYLHNNNGSYRLHFSANGFGGYSNNLAYTPGNWFTMAVTQNTSGLISWYYNGSLINTTSSTFSQYQSSQYQSIGASDNYWDGPIGVVVVYGSELTAAQVLQNHNAVRTRYGLS